MPFICCASRCQNFRINFENIFQKMFDTIVDFNKSFIALCRVKPVLPKQNRS